MAETVNMELGRLCHKITGVAQVQQGLFGGIPTVLGDFGGIRLDTPHKAGYDEWIYGANQAVMPRPTGPALPASRQSGGASRISTTESTKITEMGRRTAEYTFSVVSVRSVVILHPRPLDATACTHLRLGLCRGVWVFALGVFRFPAFDGD